MAAASSTHSLNLPYDVFVSFRGADVRKSFFSHFVKELGRKLITVFNEIEIERSDSIWPVIVQEIKNSRIAVVIFSRNYASSSWCLNQLLEIVNCKGKIVIPIFYCLEPSHVRKQTGDFGEMFERTCRRNTEEVINLWKKALMEVTTMPGFYSADWDEEANMIEEIASDVLSKLLSNSSNDFVADVSIQDHIAKMSSLLQLHSEEVRMIGMYGSSGICKTTIAKVLVNQLSRHFHVCKFINRSFVLRCEISYGEDNPNMKFPLYLQEKFLSEILGMDIEVDHLDALGEILKHQKVLIIIDDLDDQMVLDSLIAQPQRFGSGSRVIVVTNAKYFLTAHRIDHIYEVNLPTDEMGCQSACRSRFMKFLSSMWGSSTIKELPPQHKVFINFHGDEVRHGFVSHLKRALVRNNISVFVPVDREVSNGQELEVQLKMLIESRVALVIFSRTYTESTRCLTELAVITDGVEIGQLVAIPIFYNLDPSTVRGLQEEFGSGFTHLRESNATKKIWKKALMSITNRNGIVVDYRSDESEMIDEIVEEVKRVLNEGRQKASSVDPSHSIDTGIKQGLRVLGDKLELNKIRSQLGMIIGCLLLLFLCLQYFAYKIAPSSVDPSQSIDTGIKQGLKVLGDTLELNKIRSQLGMIIGCLLLLFLCLQYFAYKITPLLGAIDRIVDIPKVLEYIPADRTEITIDKDSGAKPVRSSDGKTNADLLDRTLTNSLMDGKVKPPQFQVFINFRGVQLRNYFVGYLVDALKRREVNVFIDNHEQRGEDLNTLFKRIEESGIAIVVFSTRYTESTWCLKELVKIKERVQQGLLKVLPIFYKVSPTDVKRLKGKFGDNFRDKEHTYGYDSDLIKAWKEAIAFVTQRHSLVFDENSSDMEIDFVETIVKDVLEMLQSISIVESGQSSR